ASSVFLIGGGVFRIGLAQRGLDISQYRPGVHRVEPDMKIICPMRMVVIVMFMCMVVIMLVIMVVTVMVVVRMAVLMIVRMSLERTDFPQGQLLDAGGLSQRYQCRPGRQAL